MNNNYTKIQSALLLVFVGIVAQNLIGRSWAMNVATLVGSIFCIIGFIRLAMATDGVGRVGSILIGVYAVVKLLLSPLDMFVSVVNDMYQSFNQIGMAASSFGLNFLDFDMYDTLPMYEIQEFVQESIYPLFEVAGNIFIGGALLLIAGLVCLLCHRVFAGARAGIIVALSAAVLMLARRLLYGVLSNALGWETASTISLVVGIVISLALLTGFLLIVFTVGENKEINRRLALLGLLAAGFLNSLGVLLGSNGYNTFGALCGAVLMLVAVAMLRGRSSSKRGTGAMLAYSILMIVASLVGLIPILGAMINFYIMIAATIVICVGFSRFRTNGYLLGLTPTGMRTLSTLGMLCLVLALIEVVPIFGTIIGALLLTGLFLPMMLVAVRNALATQLPEQA